MDRKRFQKLFNDLDDDQKEVVNNLEGPVLVVAGPGTGKTQTLALRVANILVNQDINPENILCLTFSESGVEQIKKRLNYVIGSTEASKVYVSTYHGFGNDLLNNELIRNDQINELSPINELGANHIIKEIIEKLPYSNQLKNNNFIKDIKNTISELKKANLDWSELQTIAKNNIDFIDKASKISINLSEGLNKVSKKSVASFYALADQLADLDNDPKVDSYKNYLMDDLTEALSIFENENSTKGITAWKGRYLAKNIHNQQIFGQKELNQKLIDLSQIFKIYIEELKRLKLYDFDDMILNAIKLLKKNKDLKYTLQERFQYILVDEYQDTNASQSLLIKLLADNPANENKPNILAVGDDDQAIYAFQGAKYSHMLEFYNNFEDVKVITLRTNYRSNDQIIDLSKKIATKISSRLQYDLKQIDKDFKSYFKNSGKIQRFHFKSELEQNSWLTNKLKEQKTQNIAVLSTKHKNIEVLANLLEEEKLEIEYDHRENILENQYFIELVYLAKTILATKNKDNSAINYLMPIVLNFEFLKLNTELIWQLSWEALDNHKEWSSIVLEKPETKDFFRFLIKLSSKCEIISYEQIIDYLIGMDSLSIDKDTFYKSDYLKHIADLDNQFLQIELFANLTSLKKHLDNYYPNPKDFISLEDFINFIDELNETNVRLNNTISFKDISNIKLMTAYGAKGLEFDEVYLMSVNETFWGEDFRGDNNKISLPKNLEYLRSNDQISRDQKLRLLYVALSRAKINLNILSYDYDLKNKYQKPLSYLEESISDHEAISPLIKDPNIKRIELKLDLNAIKNSRRAEYRPFEPNIAINKLLEKRVTEYKLSPTALNDFLNIVKAGPETFYFRHLLGYSSSKTFALIYGNIIHASLEWLIKNYKEKNSLASVKELLDYYEKILNLQKLPEIERNNLKVRGQKALTNYYQRHQQEFSKDDYSELSFFKEDVKVKNYQISGKIDRIIQRSEEIIIIDYKTAHKNYLKWQNNDVLSGYQRQLYFYHILVKNSGLFKNYHKITARVDFINQDIDKTTVLTLEDNKDQLQRIELLIEKVWDHILNLNFPNIDKYPKTFKGIVQFENDLIEGRI